MSVDEGDASAVVDDWQISDDLILALNVSDIALFVLSLRHRSHLDCGDRLFVTREHGETFFEVFIGSKVGVEVTRQNYMISLLGILQIAKILTQAGHLKSVFLFPGAEVSVDEDDVVNKEERCFVGPAHRLLLFLSHHLIHGFNCLERCTLDHDNGVFLTVSVSLVEKFIFLLGDELLQNGRILLQEKNIEVQLQKSGFYFFQLTILIEERLLIELA